MSKSFQVDQIDHVELYVPERYQAAKWFDRILGLKIVQEYENWAADPRGPLMISSDNGGTMLALFTGEPRGQREIAGHKLVAFRVSGEGFEQFLNHIEDYEVFDEAGNRVSHKDVKDHGKAFSIYFCDPYRHLYEVTTYDHQFVRVMSKEQIL